MRKRREVWTPDIYDMAQPRAAAPAEPDIYDMAQARGPGAADSDIEPLVGEGLVDAEPVIIEAPSNAAPAEAPPAPRAQPGSDNSGLFGLMAGALLGAGSLRLR